MPGPSLGGVLFVLGRLSIGSERLLNSWFITLSGGFIIRLRFEMMAGRLDELRRSLNVLIH